MKSTNHFSRTLSFLVFAQVIRKESSVVNDDVRKELLKKKKGAKTRTAVLDNNDDDDDADFIPQTYEDENLLKK